MTKKKTCGQNVESKINYPQNGSKIYQNINYINSQSVH